MENGNYTVERRRPSKPRITQPSEKRSCELHLKKDGIKRSGVAYALSFSWFAPGNWDPTNWSSRNRWFRFLTEVQPCAFIFYLSYRTLTPHSRQRDQALVSAALS